MQFQPGQSGNPNGRPKGSVGGRAKALAVLVKILGKEKNLETLERALQTAFDSNPIKFLEDYGIDLAPKEHRGESNVEGVEQSPAEICADMDKATVGDKPDVR